MSIRYRINMRDLTRGQTVQVILPDEGSLFFTRNKENEVLVTHATDKGKIDDEMRVPIVRDLWKIEYSRKHQKKGTE